MRSYVMPHELNIGSTIILPVRKQTKFSGIAMVAGFYLSIDWCVATMGSCLYLPYSFCCWSSLICLISSGVTSFGVRKNLLISLACSSQLLLIQSPFGLFCLSMNYVSLRSLVSAVDSDLVEWELNPLKYVRTSTLHPRSTNLLIADMMVIGSRPKILPTAGNDLTGFPAMSFEPYLRIIICYSTSSVTLCRPYLC